ncbi:MAG: ABC transporter ATP-binding protein [Pseudomonadota bacterium]|nr:ABC transporter ATP-binding protein [Pseudomonadota bacterium]HJO36820.1 ABC transporter ATP-binding protein [Gammaproteobacteria bacterium]
MTQHDNLVELSRVRFLRGDRPIFDGIDLNVAAGSVTAFLGPSGTGKTTLLRLISGQLRPASGSVRVDGQEVPQLRRKALYALRRQMGMLFQSGALLTDYNVFENIAFPLREHTDLPESLIRHLVLMKLELVGLRGARALMPDELSGGMARRVALARALALDPAMIMYDEPFVGLDPISKGMIVRLVRLVNDALGLTSIVVTHDLEDVLQVADYCYLISQGKVMAHGTPEALRADDSPWVRQFMRGEPDGPVQFHYPASTYAEDLLGERR